MNFRSVRFAAAGIAAAVLVSIPSFASTPNSTHSQSWQKNQWQNTRLTSANAKLENSLDSQSARQGEAVTAKLTDTVKNMGTAEFPKGTMLIGQVRQVEMSQNGGPAKIGVVFDQVRLKDGREIPIKATLVGAYPPAISNGGNSGSYLPPQPHYISAKGSFLQEPGSLNHIAMRSAVESGVSGVFMSKNHNVVLHRGTRLQLAIAPKIASPVGQAGM